MVPNTGELLTDSDHGREGYGLNGLKDELAGCSLEVELPEEQQ